MKVLNKKTNAFTIAEMLVVLVISSIVIGLTMLIMSLVQKQINAIQTNYQQATELRLLERVLLQDFNKYDLFYNDQKQQLECISPIDTVIYMFDADFVIRNTDTLKVPIAKMDCFLDGGVVKTKDIDAIELSILNKAPEKTLFISKTNDASFYMNIDGI